MTRKREKIWTAIIATKQWFTNLFKSEADALVDDFSNNPPPEIGTQPTQVTLMTKVTDYHHRINKTPLLIRNQ